MKRYIAIRNGGKGQRRCMVVESSLDEFGLDTDRNAIPVYGFEGSGPEYTLTEAEREAIQRHNMAVVLDKMNDYA